MVQPDITATPRSFRIGDWLVEPELKSISRDGKTRRLGHKVMAVLLVLAETPGRVVDKEELVGRAWEGDPASDEALTTTVYELRRALGDRASAPRYVETIRKGGYRLVASVTPVPSPPTSPDPSPIPSPSEGPSPTTSREPRLTVGLALGLVLVLALAGTLWLIGREDAPSPEVAEAVQLGEYFLRQGTPEGAAKAEDFFSRAAELDPGLPAAHLGLADARLAAAESLPPPLQSGAYSEAKEALNTALALDADHDEAHVALACIYFQHEWDFDRAAAHFARGFEPTTCSVDGGRRYAFFLSAQGRHDEAIHVLRKVLERDAASKTGRLALAWTYYIARRHDDALAEIATASLLDPEYLPLPLLESDVRLALGQGEAALAACRRSLELLGDGPDEIAALADTFESAGIEGVLRRLVERELARSGELADPVRLARFSARGGDADAAFEWLARAWAGRHDDLVWLSVDPAYDPLRTDPRFEELLARLDLPS